MNQTVARAKRANLEVFGLPVLRDGLGEVGGGDVPPEGDRALPVRRLLLVVEVVARDRLAGEGGQEDDKEEQRQRVVAKKACQAPA
jgi:hypothetical protein